MERTGQLLGVESVKVVAKLNGFTHQNDPGSQKRKWPNKRKTSNDVLLSICLVVVGWM